MLDAATDYYAGIESPMSVRFKLSDILGTQAQAEAARLWAEA